MPTRAKPRAVKTETADAVSLYELLLGRAAAEDIAPYDHAALELAADIAGRAIAGQKKGESVVSIDSGQVRRQGLPVTVVTVVNDNKPFLFDSVIGEITDSVGEPLLVSHPVIVARHGPSGVEAILGDGGPSRGNVEADRISVIHVHVKAIGAAEGEALAARLYKVLDQVHRAVADWRKMLARLDQAISQYRYAPVPLDKAAVTEAIAFLEWLRDDNFTFLGMREFDYTGGEKHGALVRSANPGLGILSDPNVVVLRRDADDASATTAEVRAFLHGPDPLLVSKANAKSLVHRRAYLDYIGVKTYDPNGDLCGELRIVGLFTSTAYTRSVMRIPYLRSKAEAVIAKSGFHPDDHSGKALINVLESYPRDELFQTTVPVLRKHAAAILGLIDRPRVRALVRPDQFDRFVSVIVFVPRDRYDSIVRERIGAYLKTVFEGRLSAYYPAFPEGGLARVHFIIGRSGGRTPKVEPAMLEASIREIVRTWEDALRDEAASSGVDAELAGVAARFPQSYRGSFSPAEALVDAGRIARLGAENTIAIDYYRRSDQSPSEAALKIYHFGSPVALSRRVPLLENMGFRVISERTFEIAAPAGLVFLHDMDLESSFKKPVDLQADGKLFEQVFLSVWCGEADNDGYNSLALTAGLDVAGIGVLRAYGRYLQQAGIPQSQGFIAAVLNRYPEIARALYSLFVARFDPAAGSEGLVIAKHLKAAIKDALENVPSIDDDTIIRRYVNLISVSLRTNHFVPADQRPGTSLAIKLESREIDGLPEPRPWREIFVYGPEVEGVHLRFGPVARGGLRWSDRAQDYRTEVLGLVKAQQVKNAVIVPVGAKGGFFPKRLPAGGSRDAVFEAGTKAYVNFVSSLLSITDNLDGDKVVPPAGVVRRDSDDPYFVVAADKGTATFSDTANAISQKYGFWLDDAFASGGSAGYDHKKMGITARGAWEAVKRHFREMNRDIQTSAFTVAGVGDMSGDVFGNGMLLSPEIRLVAAFDHRDIFIDPHPDPATSLAERQRLFDLPRSSWQDYDKSKLSAGGIIVSRAQKSVTLSEKAAAAIGLAKKTASPVEILSAILKAPVDLLWFGGIGTYVKASTESHQDVGDRANDAIRVDAREVRAKVIGEGANLGVTQKARIEYGLAGGACNSDAIDNSGGVNSSDVEVNIKIALAQAMRKGVLTRKARNKLLAEMTDEVAALVLANNYEQTLAISQSRKRGLTEMSAQARMMSALESQGLLDRHVETLPSPAAMAERQARGEPLTRAEIGVLLAYAKIVLVTELVASDLPDQSHFEQDLLSYFPARMAKSYADEIRGHRLRREIIARAVTNDVVDRGGPSFVTSLREATGRSSADIVRAFATVRDGFELSDLYRQVDALDNRIDGQVQLDFYLRIGRLLQSATAWYLKNDPLDLPLDQTIGQLRTVRKVLEQKLPEMLPTSMKERLAERRRELVSAGAPEGLAERLALASVANLVPDIDLVARKSGADIVAAARAFIDITHAFRIGRIEEAARAIAPTDYYDGLALTRAIDTIGAARRGIAVAAFSSYGGSADPVAAWLEAGASRIAQVRERLQALTESGDITVSRLSVASGMMADLSAA